MITSLRTHKLVRESQVEETGYLRFVLAIYLEMEVLADIIIF